MSNPFNPAPGALPERIIGREPELAAIKEAIRRASAGSAPLPVVFLGQRGMGKTVLLRAVREEGGRASLPLALEALPGRSLADDVREKVEGIIANVESLPSRASHALEKAVRALPKVSYELPHGQGAIAITGAPAPERDGTLAAMLEALRTAARAAHRYLSITVDEIQDVDVLSMQTLVRFVHESAQSDSPVLLACAGLGDSYRLLEQMRTYVQRWATFELRLLTEAETVEAVREPIVAAKASITDDALYLIVRESGGYPFFIAAYGSSVWEARHGRTITLADVEKALPEIRARNEMAFYVRPLARMSLRETLFAIALAELGAGAHDVGSVARALGATAPDVSSIRGTLVRKGIISAPIPGKIEFRIPFTDRYLRDHRTEYESAEVLAYRDRFRERSKNG